MTRSPERGTQSLPALTVRTKYWFEVDGQFAIGEGGISLLRAIAERGTLARAAQDIGWSYRHAWGYLRHAEAALGVSVNEPAAGQGEGAWAGSHAGGAPTLAPCAPQSITPMRAGTCRASDSMA